MNPVFFRHFESKSKSGDASSSPFCRVLDEEQIPYKIFFGGFTLSYSRRVWLVLFGWPKLLLFAFFRTLYCILFRRQTDIYVAWTHLEILPAILINKILLRKKIKIVLVGFIYTRRKNNWKQRLRYAYFHWLLKYVDKAIVHTKLEAYDYRQLFGFWDKKFVYHPFGTHVNLIPNNYDGEPYLFSAGRSGRDYPLLLSAIENLPYKLRIATDAFYPESTPENVELLHSCYGGDYLRQLTDCVMTVIPLSQRWISSGQMVLLESMAMGKPVIITANESTIEYVSHDFDAWLVPIYDVNAFRNAIDYLMNHPEIRERIGAQAQQSFREKYSMEAATKRLCQLLKQIDNSNETEK